MRRALTELGLAVVMLVLAPASVRGADPLDPDTAAALHDYVAAELDALGVPGAAVAVVREDAIVFAEGFGRADDGGREVTPQTPFDLASVSKMLTAIAVFQQVEAGNLGLDDRVQEHLSWFGTDEPALGEVTVSDLLGHTSGWTTYDGIVNILDEDDRAGAIERNARRLASTAPSNDRGTFEYSNANYDVLAHLVEAVTGVGFDEYLETNVFAPLGMEHSHVSREAGNEDGAARGFYPFFGVPVQYDIPFAPSGLGSGFVQASAEDVGRALIMHLQDGRVGETEVLSSESVRALQRPISRPSASDGYAGGMWVYPLYVAGSLNVEPDRTSYQVPVMLEHGGDHATTATGVLLLPEDGWGVVVLMNMNDGSVGSRFHQMHYGIAAILLGTQPGATVAYEDVVSQYWKVIFGAIVALQVVGVILALRRIAAWRRHPERRPIGSRLLLGHVALPLAVDLAVAAAVWWLVLDRAQSPLALIVRYSPDIFLALVIVTVLSVGWGALRSWLTLRRARADQVTSASPA
jgi:CubicO group peptidase (beta-lactamase class C family)